MQDLIATLAARFGLKPEQAQTGLATIVQFVEAQLPPKDFAKLAQKLPQVAGLGGEALTMTQPAAKLPEGAVAALLGKVPNVTELVAQLAKAGIPADRVVDFVQAALEQVRATAGEDAYRKVASALPGLVPATGLVNRLKGLLGR